MASLRCGIVVPNDYPGEQYLALFDFFARSAPLMVYNTRSTGRSERDRQGLGKEKGKKRCQGDILIESSEAVRSERTPCATESPEHWDWKAHYGLEDAQRRRTMVPDTFSSARLHQTVAHA